MRRVAAAVAALLLAVPACTWGRDGAAPGGSASPSPLPSVSLPPAVSDLSRLYAQRPPAASEGPRGGRAVVAVAAEAAVLDPFAPGGDTAAARDLAPLWLPGLYRMLPDGTRAPWLATGRPVVSADGRRVSIDLRDDARWSDGSRITSADVAATWRYAVARPNPWRAAYAVLAGVETPSPTRATLVLRQRGVTWARLFTAPTGVLPAAKVTAGRAYDLSVTGGPFTRSRTVEGLETVWRRTPHPWPGSDPLLDELVTRVVPDFATAVELLRAGQLDAVTPYTAVNAEARLRAAGATTVRERGLRSAVVLLMNTRKGPLADVRVRQALAAALDRGTFAEVLLRDGGALADDVVPPGAPGHRLPFRRWRADRAAADRLLDAAGWSERSGGRPRTRKGAELTLVLATASPDDLEDTVIRGLQVQLRPLGVQVDIAAADAAVAERLARSGQADLALVRWDAEPVTDLPRLVGAEGLPAWSDAAATRLLDAVHAAPGLPALDDAVAAATARVADQVPVLPLHWVHPVTAGRGVHVEPPVPGYGGPFAAVDRWYR